MQEIFKVVDKDNSGKLSVKEFKDFILSRESKINFRKIMRKVKEATKAHEFNLGLWKPGFVEELSYVPLTFESMLNHLHSKTERES